MLATKIAASSRPSVRAVLVVLPLFLLLSLPLDAGRPPRGEVIYSGFGVGDTFNENSGHHVSMGDYGESDVAGAFTVPTARTYSLLSIEVAVGLFQGANELDVWLLGSRMGTDAGGNERPEPDDSDVIEYFRVSDEMTNGGILKIDSAVSPILAPGTQYWVVLSTPINGSYVMWYSAAPELKGGPGQWGAQREDNAGWNVVFSSPGKAFRITGKAKGPSKRR